MEYRKRRTQSESSLPHDIGQSVASIHVHHQFAGYAMPKVPSYQRYASEQPQSQDSNIGEYTTELHGGGWYPQPSAPPYAVQLVQGAEYVQQSDPADDTGVHGERPQILQPQIPQRQIQEPPRSLHEHPDHSDNRFLESPLGFGSWGQYRYLVSYVQ